MSESAAEVRHERDRDRYVITLDGEEVGHAVSHERGTRHLFVHTEIDPGHKGQGLAGTLVHQALDDVRSRGGMVVPLCPYVAGWIEDHPDYEDLVDHETLALLDK